MSKTFLERETERNKANLPIFSKRDEFIQKLLAERVVVVKAETGSGKTTQLPQYLADSIKFCSKKLICCTQPRTFAATSVARRIAQEYDGGQLGNNVGYRVKNGLVEGRRIMMVTDSVILKMIHEDPTLSYISVLIVDEAHERAIYSDIVVGICLQLLQKRQDFYVVISSATIDSQPFLNFFSKTENSLMEVSGRVFPVSLEYKSIKPKSNFCEEVASATLQAVMKYNSGDCLVFLQGKREIAETKSIFDQKKQALINIQSFECFSGIDSSIEKELFSCNTITRKVIFSTNVAETSVTFPNISLVIDSGLAKESQYDSSKQMTILEEVFISRSNADQRKGRAGRVRDGHCIRLYEESDITRATIMPEICRTSIDKVVLHLLELRIDPLKFPLIDPISPTQIEQSIHILKQTDCVDSDCKVTQKGRIVLQLDFDPILSNFVICGGNIAYAKIASILTASAFLFYMGGGDSTEEKTGKEFVIEKLKNYKSDIDFFYETYNQWNQSTDKKTYSAKTRLNYKVMLQIEKSVKRCDKILSPIMKDFSKAYYDSNQVGKLLCLLFPNHICQTLLIKYPERCAVLDLYPSEPCFVSQTSALSHTPSQYFLSYSLNQNTSLGRIYASYCHPIDLDYIDDTTKQYILQKTIKIEQIVSVKNVGMKLKQAIWKSINHIQTSNEMKQLFRCCENNTFSVYGPSSIPIVTREKIKQLIEDAREKLLCETEEDVQEKIYSVFIKSGLQVSRIVLHKWRLKIEKKTSLDEFKPWLCEIANIKKEDIVECIQTAKNSPVFYVQCKDEISCRKIQQAIQNNAECRQIQANEHTENWSRQLTFCYSKYNTNTDQLKQQFQVTPKLISSSEPRYVLNLNSLPITLNKEKLHAIGPAHEVEFYLTKNGLTGYAKCIFKTEEDRNIFKSTFESEHSSAFTICIRRGKYKSVTPKVESGNYAGHTKYSVMCKTAEEATRIFDLYTNSKEVVVHGFAKIRIPHYNLYNLKDIIDSVASDIVECKICQDGWIEVKAKKAKRPSPKDICKVVSAINLKTRPLVINICERKLKKFFEEVINTNTKYRKLEAVSNIEIEYNLQQNRISIFGSHNEQAKVLQHISSLFENFEKRYSFLELNFESVQCLQRDPKGMLFYTEMKKLLPNEFLELLKDPPGVEIVLPENSKLNVESICDCFKSHLNNRQTLEHKSCVFCGTSINTTLRELSICGHFYCNSCLDSVVLNYDSSNGPTSCRTCNTPIYVKDFTNSDLGIRKNVKLSSKKSISHYLTNNPSLQLCLCPVSDCTGIFQCPSEYSHCLSCHNRVCIKCNTINDEAHSGVSCVEFKKRKEEVKSTTVDVKSLLQQAESFVSTNWDTTIGTLFRTDQNPGLYSNCPALQRYASVYKLFAETAKKDISFYFHGTSDSAITQICHEGFDPKRRVGQACGRGEYFGCTPIISNGYCKGGGRMILACVIDVGNTYTTKNTSLVVVDNPVDWAYSFCLPLLVLTFKPELQSVAPNFYQYDTISPSLYTSPRYNLLNQITLRLNWKTRNDAMLILAHALIWQAECGLYGGFIRDWVIRGEEANDIDVALPTNSTLNIIETRNRVVAQLKEVCDTNHFSLTEKGTKGKAYTVTIHGCWNGKNIEIDLVDTTQTKEVSPYVDSDVGNFMITSNGIMKKINSVGTGLEDATAHCINKQFVFFYNTHSTDSEVQSMCLQRLRKYLSRGWTCLNQLSTYHINQLKESYEHLLRPMPEYNLNWWESKI